jgi:DNA-binding LacI/PurR family transcriptional regulator
MMDWPGDPYQDGILKGILESTKAGGANTLCFVGGPISSADQSNSRNQIYDLIGTHNVEGVTIITSPLMHDVGRAGMDSFLRRCLSGLPYSSIGVELDAVPSVFVSNTSGIEHVMSHLIREHKRKRIAFVRGPLANDEAETRFKAYRRMLERFELEFDPRWVAVGDFTEPSGKIAARELSRIPGHRLEEFDAIVASNDNMALGLGAALEELGLLVPNNIALTGFDDIEESKLTASPLTTVRQPLEKVGRQAARDMLSWMQVGTLPKNVEIETELVIRRSCGCTGNVVDTRTSAAPDAAHGFDAALVMRRQRILDTLTRVSRGELGSSGSDWQVKALNAFVAEVRDEKPDAFRGFIDEMARRRLARGLDLQVCHELVDALRAQLVSALESDPVRRDKAEGVFHLSHRALSEATQRSMMREKLQLARWAREVAYVCNALSSSFSLTTLTSRIREHLPRLGLKSYFVVTYSREYGKKRAEVLAAFDAGQALEIAPNQDFDASILLPKHLMDSVACGRAFAVLPLCCENQCLGHALMEFSLEQAFFYRALSEAIGMGIYAARLTAAH